MLIITGKLMSHICLYVQFIAQLYNSAIQHTAFMQYVIS